MNELSPYEEIKLLHNLLVETVGAVKAKKLIDKAKYEYAMIRNQLDLEIR